MKKIILITLLCCVSLIANAQLKVSTHGNVGIGTTLPHYKFDLNLGTTDTFRIHTWMDAFIDNTGAYGALCFYPEYDYYLQLGKNGARVGQIWACELKSLWSIEYSDFRLKENIRPIKNSLQKIKMLNGVQYNLKGENFENIPDELKVLYTGDDYGFIAQDLREIFPEVVVEDKDGTLSVKYTRLVPIIVEAIKEQQKTIDSMQQSYAEERSMLLEAITELQTKLVQQSDGQSLDINYDGHSNDLMRVYQNAPNPFSETTSIRCYIPQNKHSAQLCIYDMQGVQRKCVNVSGRGMVDVNITAGELHAGIYLYLLQADGQVSEAKQMIITQ